MILLIFFQIPAADQSPLPLHVHDHRQNDHHRVAQRVSADRLRFRQPLGTRQQHVVTRQNLAQFRAGISRQPRHRAESEAQDGRQHGFEHLSAEQ